MPQYNQVSGGSSYLTLYAESAPGEPGAVGYIIPIQSESLQQGTNKSQRSIISGKRGPGKPSRGLPSPSGQVVMAASATHMGVVFRSLCGQPVSTACSPAALAAEPVTDLGGGTVLLAAPEHGYLPDDVISIVGSAHYDGVYTLTTDTTPDALGIVHLFQAETPAAGARAVRGRRALLAGEVRDLGEGKVGLPVINTAHDGVPHVFRAGDSITLSGAAGYDGEYTVDAASTERLLVIAAAYTAATLPDDGSAVGLPVFYRHEYELPKKQPTQTWEKYFDFDASAAANPYRRFSYCKMNGLSFDMGGDGEFLLTWDVSSGGERGAPAPLSAAPLRLPQVYIDKPDLSLYVNGARVGYVATASFSSGFGITPANAVGDGLRYTRMPEGDPEISLQMTTYLETDEMQVQADADVTLSVRMYGSGTEGDAFAVTLPEAVLDTSGASISGKEGLQMEVTAMAFVDAAPSVLGLTLINRMESYQ